MNIKIMNEIVDLTNDTNLQILLNDFILEETEGTLEIPNKYKFLGIKKYVKMMFNKYRIQKAQYEEVLL